MLLDDEAANLAELQGFIGKPVRLQVEGSYPQHEFDVVPS
jgi:ribonuclease G